MIQMDERKDRIHCVTYYEPKRKKYYEVCGRETGQTDENGQPVLNVVSDRDVTNEIRKKF